MKNILCAGLLIGAVSLTLVGQTVEVLPTTPTAAVDVEYVHILIWAQDLDRRAAEWDAKCRPDSVTLADKSAGNIDASEACRIVKERLHRDYKEILDVSSAYGALAVIVNLESMRRMFPRARERSNVFPLPSIEPETTAVIGKIYTVLTGKLCLIAEEDGKYFAHVTDIPVSVPDCVRDTAMVAAGIVGDKYRERIKEKELQEIKDFPSYLSAGYESSIRWSPEAVETVRNTLRELGFFEVDTWTDNQVMATFVEIVFRKQPLSYGND